MLELSDPETARRMGEAARERAQAFTWDAVAGRHAARARAARRRPRRPPRVPVSAWAVCLLNWNGREDTLRCLDALRDLAGERDRGGRRQRLRGRQRRRDPGGPSRGRADRERRQPRLQRRLQPRDPARVRARRVVGRAAQQRRAARSRARCSRCRPRPRAGRPPACSPAACSSPTAGSSGRASASALLSGYSGRPRGYGREDAPEFRIEGPVERAVGALMAVSRDAVEAAGELDEGLFAYVEDVDWSLRIREAGFECILVPGAAATHALAASSGGRLSTGPSTTACATRSSSASATGRSGAPARCCAGRASSGRYLARALLVVRSRAAVRARVRGLRGRPRRAARARAPGARARRPPRSPSRPPPT